MLEKIVLIVAALGMLAVVGMHRRRGRPYYYMDPNGLPHILLQSDNPSTPGFWEHTPDCPACNDALNPRKPKGTGVDTGTTTSVHLSSQGVRGRINYPI